MPPLAVLIVFVLPLIQGAPVRDNGVLEYLQKFGYIQPAKLVAEGVEVQEDDPATILTNAIKRFQTSAGIPVTGELDEVTKKKMRAPRCGVPEFAALKTDGGDDIWAKKDLTYTLDTDDSGMSESETRNAIQASFGVFEAVVPLKFKEVKEDADINIRFGRGQHDCFPEEYPDDEGFDGNGGTLAHAYFPENGRVHFDADEKWTVMNQTNLPTDTHTDFYGTAIHEIAHALGIHHVDDPTSVMAAFDVPPKDEDGNYKEPKLDAAVIETLQNLYGRDVAPTDGTGGGGKDNHHCLKHVYAAVTLPNFRFMLFNDKGSRVTVFNARTRRATQSGPLSEFFSGGPENIFSAYYNKKDSYIMLFKGNQVWRYNFSRYQFKLASGYPAKLPVESDWKTYGAWNTPDTVLVNDARTLSRYNEKKNTIEELGHITEVYPNILEDVAGFADINGKEVGFTEDKVFTYDWKTKTHKHLGSIGEFLHC